jgi:hypothetical protein
MSLCRSKQKNHTEDQMQIGEPGQKPPKYILLINVPNMDRSNPQLVWNVQIGYY